MNMNVDFFAQMIAEASPLLQNPSSTNANGQFITPNPNTFATMNQSDPDFTSNAADLSGVDILDFIPAAAVAEQHQIQIQQQQQQFQLVQQLQQYLQTPKSAVTTKFQLTGGSNFSTNPTPSFGSIATFSNSSFVANNSNSDDAAFASASIPVTAQFSPITPNIMNFGSQLNLPTQNQQQQAAVEQRSSTPSSVQAMGNSPLQFSPQQPHYTSTSRVSSSATSVADNGSPTIGLGVSVIDPAPQQSSSSIIKITKKQPSPHEQAAFQFQQQVNNEASKSSLNHKRVSSTSSSATTATASSTSKLQSQLDAQLQKLIEQQREKQQQQLLLLKKGEIPKPPELKPKRKSSCRPHKQKRRLQQQQQQFLQLRKISPPPLQPITGDSPTTIEVASPELDMNNELSFANNTSAFMFGGNITAEELLSNDLFEALGGNTSLVDCKGDLLSEFIDFEYEETTTGDLEKSITDDDFDFLNLNNKRYIAANTSSVLPQRPVLKKKKSVVSSTNVGTTATKIGKKTLKKASSFSGGSTPTFIMNPKLQWTKSQANEQQRQRLIKRNVSHGHTQSMSDLATDCNGIVQGMPVFTLSNHYLFVYETADTIYQDENCEDSSIQTTPRKQHSNPMVSEVDLLKNLESGLGEFKLDFNKRK